MAAPHAPPADLSWPGDDGEDAEWEIVTDADHDEAMLQAMVEAMQHEHHAALIQKQVRAWQQAKRAPAVAGARTSTRSKMGYIPSNVLICGTSLFFLVVALFLRPLLSKSAPAMEPVAMLPMPSVLDAIEASQVIKVELYNDNQVAASPGRGETSFRDDWLNRLFEVTAKAIGSPLTTSEDPTALRLPSEMMPPPSLPSAPPVVKTGLLAGPFAEPYPPVGSAIAHPDREDHGFPGSPSRLGHYVYCIGTPMLCAYLFIQALRLVSTFLSAFLRLCRSVRLRDSAQPRLWPPSQPAAAIAAAAAPKASGKPAAPPSTPKAVPVTPRSHGKTEAAALPVTRKANAFNEFQKAWKGHGYSSAQLAALYREHKAAAIAPAHATATSANRRPAARAAAVTPRRLDLGDGAPEGATASPPKTWRDLQRSMGGKGFTRKQMSLMWSAHKRGVSEGAPLTYHTFRTHCKGQGIARSDLSALWAHHKLFSMPGIKCAPRARGRA